jgi:sugar-phosphatase
LCTNVGTVSTPPDPPVIWASALLLDLDGVLVDSSAAIFAAWEEWARGHRLDPVATFALGHGRSTLDHIRAVAGHLASPAEAMRIDAAEEAHLSAVTAQPGAVEFCTQLNGLRWGHRHLLQPGGR